jgi:hypothetical protein
MLTFSFLFLVFLVVAFCAYLYFMPQNITEIPCKRCGYGEAAHKPVWDVVQCDAVYCEGYIPDNLAYVEALAKQKHLI